MLYRNSIGIWVRCFYRIIAHGRDTGSQRVDASRRYVHQRYRCVSVAGSFIEVALCLLVWSEEVVLESFEIVRK